MTRSPQTTPPRRRHPALWMAFCLTLLAALCTVGATPGMPGCASLSNSGFFDGGVTTGGAQDMARARAVIEAGGVPDPDSITVEGLLSEHSIPLPAPDDTGAFYAVAEASWAADFDTFTPLVTIQAGFGTTIDFSDFARSPLNLAIVIDRSGSMDDTIDRRTGASKWDAARVAVDRLAAQLDSGDLVSIVLFNDETRTTADGVPGSDIGAIKSGLDGVRPDGATNFLRGMSRGYELVNKHRSSSRRDRIIVLTDALPTEGGRSKEGFLDLMEEYADREIGATLFGVGVDFGDELTYDISQVRGGNFFFLSDYDRIITVLDEEFDYLVTPVAYDLKLTVSVPFEFDVEDVYGVPFDDPPTHMVEVDVPTLFLSRREGGAAIFIRLRPGALVDLTQAVRVAGATMSYRTADGQEDTDTFSVRLPGNLDPAGETPYFANDAVRRGVLLMNTALVLQRASNDAYDWYRYASYYGGDGAWRALDRLERFLTYFDQTAEGLEDRLSESSRALSEEREVVARLRANIQSELGLSETP